MTFGSLGAVFCLFLVSFTQGYDLHILHLNDHHSHIKEDDFKYDVSSLGMSDSSLSTVKVMYGGYPRLVTLFKDTAASGGNVLKLHAGDAMTGTAYYSIFKGDSDAEVMAHVCFDAFVPGNHEFDDGDANLAAFIDKLQSFDSVCPDTPVLGANIIPGRTSPLVGKMHNTTIKEIGGEKIGLVGVDVRGKTMDGSNPDPGTYLIDEKAAAQAGIDHLKAEGVNKIVLVSHAGYEMDKMMAESLTGIDAIVGGDSHTLLDSSGKAGLVGNVAGPFPTELTNADGDKVCVVQAWEYAHVMGHLMVSFDGDGKVTSCSGSPKFPISDTVFDPELSSEDAQILVSSLDSNVFVPTAANPDVAALVTQFSTKVTEMEQMVIATASETLCLERFPGQGQSVACDSSASWLHGSDIGNIVCKSFLMTTKTAHIAIQQAGGVRTDIKEGDVTMNDMYKLLPFSNTIVTLEMDGHQIKNVLEDALSHVLDMGGSTSSYPYAAGLRFSIDASRNKYSRVYDIEVNPRLEGEWTPIDMTDVHYTVATNNYIAGGKDGYLTFGVIPDALKLDTQINYVKPMIEYVQQLGTISKLPLAEYSTQSYVNKNGCPHWGYAAGECPEVLPPPTCDDVRTLYKTNDCCGKPAAVIQKLPGIFAYLKDWRRLTQNDEFSDTCGQEISKLKQQLAERDARIKVLEQQRQQDL